MKKLSYLTAGSGVGFQPQRKPTAAFTLVEVLVVIAVIGILAALVVGLAGPASERKRISLVRGQLAQIETAIDQYKGKLGFYPPDNTNRAATGPYNYDGSAMSPLYYELVGVTFDAADPNNVIFYPPNGASIPASAVRTLFYRDGIANSAAKTGEDKVPNFFKTMSAQQHATVSGVEVLRVPVEGIVDGPNLWHYVSTTPTNNTGSFDLWTEIKIGGKTRVIGNFGK